MKTQKQSDNNLTWRDAVYVLNDAAVYSTVQYSCLFWLIRNKLSGKSTATFFRV
jgi:hypothetical protein